VVVLSLADHHKARPPALELRIHHYDQVILAVDRQPGTRLARALRRDPANRLRLHLGRRLIAFPLGDALTR
jgi:hypothetical protein